MTTAQGSPSTQSRPPEWQVALADFRARAARLFETQRDRVEFLEASIAEQLALLDREEEDSQPATAHSGPEVPEASPDELEELRTQLAQCRKLLNARASELKQLRGLLADETEQAEEVDVATILEELSEMRLERDDLIGRLADAERRIEQPDADAAYLEELQGRFEVAVQEIRELRSKNAELQKQASRGEDDSRDATAAPASGFDWEQQKLRLMQQLESDFEDADTKEKETKLSIESTIRITDQVIAEKDRQIADLKSLLDEKADAPAESAPTNSVLDDDEQIRQELERLNRLEEEWKDKLRQAEIDISVERAKLARERAEFEANLRNIEPSSEVSPDAKATAKQSGRWLSRLGLKDDEK